MRDRSVLESDVIGRVCGFDGLNKSISNSPKLVEQNVLGVKLVSPKVGSLPLQIILFLNTPV
jgi:hypothetical protein